MFESKKNLKTTITLIYNNESKNHTRALVVIL